MELQFVRESRVTIVVSDVEASVIKRYLPDASVTVISNIIGFRGIKTSRLCFDRNGILFVGNFNHLPNQQGLKWFLENVFPLLGPMQERHPLHIVASNSMSGLNRIIQEAGISNGSIRVHGYLTDNELQQLYMEVRAVIAPLLSGAGVKGKVNQAMSYGVPVVATPIAIEGMHAKHGRDCLVSGNPTDFAIFLRRVLDDCRLWGDIVSNAFANVQTFFSPEVAHARLTSVLHLCNA
ncbi:glycosyl transferases group 1-domain-containing protein [Dunaliella salina]|uniref:Glycosyl transferases group 1-domain-containing protein n=1 Tax=Dunaliella salina TaxID=3046 RepID=A0ABQ7G3R6_DUNSA|nr:glycosyl transferases group 1-domain-containing protein [Dunaliella salina]|eukprot:KAF5829252.1 glycosyl transferases group 1-domain-containing protein [Dunaliella salina]